MENKVEIEKIREISISNVLKSQGVSPVRYSEKEEWYYALTRIEKTPSLKVDLLSNRFYDFGSGEHGSVIDLVMLLRGCRVREAINFLHDFDGAILEPVKCSSNNYKEKVSKIEILSVAKLEAPGLIYYAKSRGVNKQLLSAYCSEVHFKIGAKKYYSIGFKNDKGGFELRNKIFKISSSPKWFSHIKNGGNKLVIFEGFFDLLSFLTIKKQHHKGCDFIVLNSVANIPNLPYELLHVHEQVFVFLDNDRAGKKGTETLLLHLPNAIDCSSLYENFKDVNEWLMHQK